MIGDHLRNRMVIYGHPSCTNTAKCLQTAAEKGVDIESKVIDINNPDAEFLEVSPLGVGPALKDVKFNLSGTLAVMSYLDDKGFGPSLVPRNGVAKALMYQWITIAMDNVQPLIHAGDMSGLSVFLDAFEKAIANPRTRGDFALGEFSLLDIHWCACMNTLAIKGHEDKINARPGISKWFNLVKQHPSTSKEKIIPFTSIPTAQDVESNVLRNISINV